MIGTLKSAIKLLGLPDIDDDSFEHYHADVEGDRGRPPADGSEPAVTAPRREPARWAVTSEIARDTPLTRWPLTLIK
ncbi:unnamed protein product [Boreogadus saida]